MPDRLMFTIPLRPAVGHRFQPTGFPDLGAATFERPDGNGKWVPALLLESEQSMANHLEAAGWDRGADAPHPLLKGLPYVRVVNADGEFLTSSRTEAHRLSSAFIREGIVAGSTKSGTDYFREQFDLRDDVPLSGRHIASAVFGLDPLCLLHGAFFADPKLPGQPKITRALTSFIEASDIRAAESGGVKKDDVRHKNEEGGGSTEGYGSVPFHRTQYTAQSIEASFVLDKSQLRSYGLSHDATRLLEVLALWEIASLLERGLRLRTSCDLVPVGELPADLRALPQIEAELAGLIASQNEALNGGRVLDVRWTGSAKKNATAKKNANANGAPEDDTE